MAAREKFWIDDHVQGVLIGRLVLYCGGIVIYVLLSTICNQYWANPEWTLGQHIKGLVETTGFGILTMLILLPLIGMDLIRVSHRFAGPIYRLKMHLKELLADSSTAPLSFRDDDHFQHLAQPINELQSRVLQLQREVDELKLEKLRLIEANDKLASSAGYVRENAL